MAVEEGPRSGGVYEFDTRQNQTIDGLSTALRALAFFFLVYGALSGIWVLDHLHARAFVTAGRTVIEAALYVTMSRFFHAASKALAAVVDTRGNDIAHLLRGLDVVRRAIVVWGYAMFGLLTLQLLYMGAIFAARHFGVQLPER
jgi:hypothetical protein